VALGVCVWNVGYRSFPCWHRGKESKRKINFTLLRPNRSGVDNTRLPRMAAIHRGKNKKVQEINVLAELQRVDHYQVFWGVSTCSQVNIP